MTAAKARKLTKANKNVKFYLSSHHVQMITRAARVGENYIELYDWTSANVALFQELGYLVLVTPQRHSLIVSW